MSLLSVRAFVEFFRFHPTPREKTGQLRLPLPSSDSVPRVLLPKAKKSRDWLGFLQFEKNQRFVGVCLGREWLHRFW
jgi:hypothetical protein